MNKRTLSLAALMVFTAPFALVQHQMNKVTASSPESSGLPDHIAPYLASAQKAVGIQPGQKSLSIFSAADNQKMRAALDHMNFEHIKMFTEADSRGRFSAYPMNSAEHVARTIAAHKEAARWERSVSTQSQYRYPANRP